MENILEQERYLSAKKKVEKIKGFYGNLVSYIVVNLVLFGINMSTYPDYLWFFWPLLGWGIGLFFHGLSTFEIMPFFGKDWEKRKIQEFMDKENEQKNKWS